MLGWESALLARALGGHVVAHWMTQQSRAGAVHGARTRTTRTRRLTVIRREERVEAGLERYFSSTVDVDRFQFVSAPCCRDDGGAEDKAVNGSCGSSHQEVEAILLIRTESDINK